VCVQGPEIERRQKERQARERAEYAEGTDPIAARVAEAHKCRREGNVRFGAGDLAGAKQAYDSGFMGLVVTKEEWDGVAEESGGGGGGGQGGGGALVGGLSPEDKAAVSEARALLHLNRSLANLRLGRTDPALWDADRALDHHASALALRTGATANVSDGGGGVGKGGGGGDDDDDAGGTAVAAALGGLVAKAKYRRGVALTALAKAELAKEEAAGNGGRQGLLGRGQDAAFGGAGPGSPRRGPRRHRGPRQWGSGRWPRRRRSSRQHSSGGDGVVTGTDGAVAAGHPLGWRLFGWSLFG